MLGVGGSLRYPDWFETSILNLFGIISFITLYFGGKIHAEGIDILAFHPVKPIVFVISVTTSHDIGKKIGTLLPQLHKIKNIFSKGVLDYETIPVIITPTPAESIRDSASQDVKSHEVVLLLNDEIERIYQTVLEVGDVDLLDIITEFIQDKIPDGLF